MKICRFSSNQDIFKRGRLGILLEETGIIVDCNTAWALNYQREGKFNPYEKADHQMPSSLATILKLKDDPFESLEESLGLYYFLEKVGDLKTREGLPIFFDVKEASLMNPMDAITSYRDFYAHEKHVKTSFKKRNATIPDAWYEIPAYYKGATNGFIGPGEEILWPSYTDKLDYELELAIVLGREGRNIKSREAVDHIFGLTILNDISARDIQRKEMTIRLGPAKGKDFCSVLGPVIVTMDEFDFKEPNLLMTASINGSQWSKGYSGDARYSWAEMLVHLSRDEWVLPGDVMASGTVGTGCGMELDRWIKPGDTVELDIEKIGKLINKVGKKQDGKF